VTKVSACSNDRWISRVQKIRRRELLLWRLLVHRSRVCRASVASIAAGACRRREALSRFDDLSDCLLVAA
jgi:hypothetical protein